MIPPGPLRFFYSTSDNNTFTDTSMPQYLNKNPQITNENVNITVPKINYVENTEALFKILSTDDLKTMKAIPRPKTP